MLFRRYADRRWNFSLEPWLPARSRHDYNTAFAAAWKQRNYRRQRNEAQFVKDAGIIDRSSEKGLRGLVGRRRQVINPF